MTQLAAGILFGDTISTLTGGGSSAGVGGSGEGAGGGAGPVQDSSRIFGGRAREVVVEADPPQPVVVDGELLGTTPLTARVAPASLIVLVPRPPAPAGEGEGAEGGAQQGEGEAAGAGAAALFEVGGPGAASAAAAGAGVPGTTAAGLAASRAVEESYAALDQQSDQQSLLQSEEEAEGGRVAGAGVESESSGSESGRSGDDDRA